MATLKAKKVQAALSKIINVGRSEEPVVIDGVSFVLRCMTNADYDASINETEDIAANGSGSEYMHAYHTAYVCRAIVEIEGVSLRDIDFVEDDVPVGAYQLSAVVSTEEKANKAKEELRKLGIDLVVAPPDGSEGTRSVLFERHDWVRRHLKTWSQEAVAIAYRKYADVVIAGEDRARDKVEFRTENESAEDKIRRLLTEAKTLETNVPPEILAKILGDLGYINKTSVVELDSVSQTLRNIEPVVSEAPVQSAPPIAVEPPVDVQKMMSTRQPLNRMDEPTPVSAPSQLVNPNLSSRAAQIAALEGISPEDMQDIQALQANYIGEVPEIMRKSQGLDAKGLTSIVDQPPVAGINPKFRRPNGS